MSVIRLKPMDRERFSMLEQMNRMMDEMSRLSGIGQGSTELGAWSPQVNVYEKDGNIVVEAELPGVDKDDIQVSIENGILSIRGERRKEEEVKEDDYYRVERSFGSFSRSFSLPSEVQADKVDAAFMNGVLKLTVPRAEAAKPKQIEIK